MRRQDRAKQFMPFAALKGYTEALRRKEKILVPRKELAPDYQEELDREFKKIRKNDMISVIYFCHGEYRKITGLVSKIDKNKRKLTIVHTEISLDDLYAVRRETADSNGEILI